MMRRSTFVILSILTACVFEACARVPAEPQTRNWVPAPAEAPAGAPFPAVVVERPSRGAAGAAPASTPTTAPATRSATRSAETPATRPVGTSARRKAPYRASLIAGASVEGRPIAVEVRGMGADVVLVIATIHGNEPAGTPLAQAFLQHLDRHPELLRGRRVLVMPDANPDGHAAGTRANARGVDLNRNFEAPNRVASARYGERALSEPEAQAIERVVRLHAPTRILSIHQPLGCVDWDGPAEALARKVAEASGLPLKKLGTRPGSFGAWAEAVGAQLVTLELPRGVEKEGAEGLWKRYGKALTTFALP